ncbi:hypothetical protein BJ944DRAFT_268411 [Cunninghamella echinulata]|nr:hypothetical protein BJ944DRAFT_268411 [Cunninghamella echinulata]
MRQCIKDRFGKMKLGILSTCSQIVSMGTEAGFSISYLIKPDTTVESLQSLIQQLLKEDQVDCLFIDLTVEDKDNNNFLSSWKWMDTLMKEWVDASTILKCIVTKCIDNNNNSNSDQQQQQNDSSKNNSKKSAKYYMDDIIPPPQSYEYKNGIRVKIIKDVSYVCAYYHTETTRADLVEKFNVKDMEKLGCNGSILSWHYLAEIGNKLGYVPKYGA